MPARASFVALLFLCAAAHAAPSCKNISVTPLGFGAYDVFVASPLDSAGTISYSCPRRTMPAVDISAGNSGSFSPRYLQQAGGADQLAYNVYVDAARTQVWGTTPVPLPSGKRRSTPYYGRIFALQDVSVGSYSDTLVVTFNF